MRVFNSLRLAVTSASPITGGTVEVIAKGPAEYEADSVEITGANSATAFFAPNTISEPGRYQIEVRITAGDHVQTGRVLVAVLPDNGLGEVILGNRGAGTLPAMAGAGSGTVVAPVFVASGAAILPALGGSGAGNVLPFLIADGGATLPMLTGSGAAVYTPPGVAGSGAANLPTMAVSGAGTVTAPGYEAIGNADLPPMEGAGAGTVTLTGSGAAELPGMTGSGTGVVAVPGTGAATLPGMEGAGAGLVVIAGSGAADLPMLEASAAAGLGIFGTGAATLPGMTASGTAGAIPTNTAAPAITGSGKIGDEHTTSDGTWTGAPSAYEYRWKFDDGEISGATLADYTVAEAGDLTDLTAEVRAQNAQGWSAWASSAAVAITYTAPVASGTPGDWDETENTGEQTFDAKTLFTVSGDADLSGCTFSLIDMEGGAFEEGIFEEGVFEAAGEGGPEVTINSATGVVTADTDTIGLITDGEIGVRATNSGGFDDATILLTIAEDVAEAEGATFDSTVIRFDSTARTMDEDIPEDATFDSTYFTFDRTTRTFDEEAA
jgi:hypothetical protein